MKLWVLRHGEAEPQVTTDAQRELTAHGCAQVVRSAKLLVGQPLDAILVSPYMRAQQTAALVRETLDFEPDLITVPWLTPDSDPKAALKLIPELGNTLLVSHQPFVGDLISLLQHGHYREPQPMQTASLAELEGEWPLAGSMTLLGVRHC